MNLPEALLTSYLLAMVLWIIKARREYDRGQAQRHPEWVLPIPVEGQ